MLHLDRTIVLTVYVSATYDTGSAYGIAESSET